MMTSRRVRILIAALLLGAGGSATIAGCGGEDGPSPTGNADGSAAADAPDGTTTEDAAPQDAAPSCKLPGKYGSKECTACVGARCCAQVTSCEADADCKLLQACHLTCLSKPDGGGCYKDCMDAHPAGAPLWAPIHDCFITGPPPTGCLIECTS